VISSADLAALVLLIGLVMYAVFGGADFGGGIWMALAFGPRRREQQESLFQAIGPVWETNHIWLVLVVVTLFTAFPAAFATLFTALFVPFVLTLVGISFRGAAFAFRHFGEQTRSRLPATVQVFALSSLLTPLTMGMAVTAVAAGRIRLVDGQIEAGVWSSWITPFTVMGGLTGVAVCAFLTPIFMAARVKGPLREDFRRAGMVAALVLGAITAAALPVAAIDAPDFAERLLRPGAAALVTLAILFGCGTLASLWTRRYLIAQLAAGGAVAATIGGFGAAMYPYFVLGNLTVGQAAAPSTTLAAFLGALPVGALILVPSLTLLYWTFREEPLREKPHN
jgi:cytochrome d ubiquinol oxidase subunit II